MSNQRTYLGSFRFLNEKRVALELHQISAGISPKTGEIS